MRVAVVFVSFAFFALLLAISIGWTHLVASVGRPPKGPPVERVIGIPEDMGARGGVEILAREGLLARDRWLSLWVEYLHPEAPIPRGRYALSSAMSPAQQIAHLEAGRMLTETLSIPPGAEAREIVRRLSAAGLAEEAKLEALLEEPRFLGRIGIDGRSLEGYLLPETYNLPLGLEPEEVLERIAGRFRTSVPKEVHESAREKGLSERELVTLASLVERAPIPPAERRQYAALLLARLGAKMPLESRASDEYGRRRGQSGENRWDTRSSPGLPLTPICSPSLPSLLAIAKPRPEPFLYMVRRDDGTHVYCRDVDCYRGAMRQFGHRLPKRFPRPGE